MKQTAVEWLAYEMPVIDWLDPYWVILLDKAKKMELEQMHEAYMAGAKDAQELIQKQAIEEINRFNSEG
jgi:hypothetical protein